MILGLHNYAIIVPIENRCIIFYNNKINSLQKYDIPKNYRIKHKAVQLLSQHNLKILNQTDGQTGRLILKPTFSLGRKVG
jgi:hypothetical protein